MRAYTLLLTLLMILTACNQSLENQHVQNGRFQPLDQPTEEHEGVTEEPSNQDVIEAENQYEEETTPSLPREHIEEETTETERGDEHQSPTSEEGDHPFLLSFDEFKARWNALSEETFSLHIDAFEKASNSNGIYYHTPFPNRLELRVFVTDNETVREIQVISTGDTSVERYAMLTGWWQVLMMTNPEIAEQDIDGLFAAIGVKPNANVNAVHEQTFTHGGLHYTVTPAEQEYTFTATYP